MKPALLSLLLVLSLSGCGLNWVQGGSVLARCLLGAGVSHPETYISSYGTSEGVDASRIGWAALRKVASCLAKAGGAVLWSDNEFSELNSVGASMTPTARAVLNSQGDFLSSACGDGPVPVCVLISTGARK